LLFHLVYYKIWQKLQKTFSNNLLFALAKILHLPKPSSARAVLRAANSFAKSRAASRGDSVFLCASLGSLRPHTPASAAPSAPSSSASFGSAFCAPVAAAGPGAAGDGGEPHNADERAEQGGEDHHDIGVASSRCCSGGGAASTTAGASPAAGIARPVGEGRFRQKGAA